MKLQTVITGFTILLSRISAVPLFVNGKVSDPLFLLKSVAVNGTKYDGLYVIPSHTFAGGNVPGLYKDPKYAVPAYLENDSLFFKFGKDKYDRYPFAIDYTDYAAAWYECRINIGSKPQKHLRLTENNYLITTQYGKEGYDREFHGAYWRVCKWAHGLPELFLNNPGNSNNLHPQYVPDICGLVNIKAVLSERR